MEDDYFIVDIETCPIDLEKYQQLNEEEQKKLMNPIDSKIIAIGLRYNGKNKIIMDENEKVMLEKFWSEWENIKKGNPYTNVVGFSITNFDLPFLVSKSLVHNVVICPFLLKEIVDLRDKINAYRFGRTRGTLKEYAKLIGIKTMDMDGKDIAPLCIKGDFIKISEYLEKDLEITDKLYQRAKETKILEIDKW
ncbi:hypothetical protein CO154_01900 [Candidatus Pacearchaeota archaeon CG_4_9_14_3_um_filter_31_7]|nr:MAG: hypothetical protein AUJ10_03365 [Candidatus Pacearchaeota archaeon CG1_02_31_27]PIN92446.1 MAG: hypothetical protein COU55_01430 [Candidatus Pacearchaeota archaeon CG10_big_fil_rev_8_21_14_0_10_31_59]PIZ81031.1 MAG: hypothetical protein COX99_01130 [Candidatus Pacearchaeota archaeon CG_4_10_14_0_2_um_filter_31_10]PJA70625.1 MAG: hypothetical protein CO154_01900 [Candidatus Pacearchaeota archaeon CG_4_9_14_3_um_filter_31_7]